MIFSSPTYNFTEEIGNATITLQVSEGGNDFPLDIFVSTNDITAIGKSWYMFTLHYITSPYYSL